MPYGISKRAGGDSPENVAKVERCVRARMDQGDDKVTAIRKCKGSLFGGGKKGGRRAGR